MLSIASSPNGNEERGWVPGAAQTQSKLPTAFAKGASMSWRDSMAIVQDRQAGKTTPQWTVTSLIRRHFMSTVILDDHTWGNAQEKPGRNKQWAQPTIKPAVAFLWEPGGQVCFLTIHSKHGMQTSPTHGLRSRLHWFWALWPEASCLTFLGLDILPWT